MPRRRPPHEFEHMPVGRFQWEQIVRRAELDPSTKYVGLMLSTWASMDGGDLIVGERLLADALGRGERMVREHLAKLRELGLIEQLLEAAPGRNAEYQLTFPGEDFPRVPLRLDVDGSRLSERTPGRMGQRRPSKNTGTPAPVSDVDDRHPGAASPAPGRAMTGTPAPVSQTADRHPGSGDADFTGTRAHDDRHPGAASPAPGRTLTGTRVPPTNTRPDQYQPSPLVPGSDFTLTSARRALEPSNTTQHTEPAQRAPAADAAAYRAARIVLDGAPKQERDLAIAQAGDELAPLGIVNVRQRTIRAARILTAWQTSLPPDQEGP